LWDNKRKVFIEDIFIGGWHFFAIEKQQNKNGKQKVK
jgi:hypothetical protein